MEDNTEDVGLTDFDLAFEAAAGLGEEPAPPPVDDPPDPEPPKEDELPPVEDAKADGQPTAEETQAEPPKEEPRPEPLKPEPPKPPVVDEAAVAARAEADRVAKEAADKAVAEAAAKEQFTDADQEVLARTAEDFPDVAKAFEIRERVLLAKIENLLSGKLGQLTAQFDQRLAPVLPVVQNYARNEFTAAVIKAHPDAFDVLPKVEAWVAQQPKILQPRLNAILDGGTVAETIELYDVFKKANVVEGAHSDDKAKLEADNAAKAAAEADREKKLKAQEGVRSRQTAQKSSIDENDFEGAFALAANS